MTEHLILITGTWSTGKTTLLERLGEFDDVVGEPGREIAIETGGYAT